MGQRRLAGPMIVPVTVRSKNFRVVALLVLFAALAVGLIGAGGYTVYANMKHAERERGWADHSQTILTSLQMQAERLDRVDYNLQLYFATGEHARLKGADASLASINVSLVSLNDLMKDNDSQTRHIEELDRAMQNLTAALNSVHSQTSAAPEAEVLAARNAISILQQEERGLLRQRTDLSKAGLYRSYAMTMGFLGVSLAIVVLLFMFLFRDASLRRKDEAVLFEAKGELEATVRKLRRRAEESKLLTSARDEMQLCTTAQQAHESAVQYMQQLLPGSSGATLMIDNSRRMVEIAAKWGTQQLLLDGFNPDDCCGLRGGKARWRKAGKSELHCGHFVGAAPESYFCVPLAAHGETLGVVFVTCDTAEALQLAEERSELVQELAELASMSIASLNLRAKLERQSIRDGLTGLFNRHFMEIALERELSRAARHKTSVAVLMMDVDHFKVLNDTYGHEAGDLVLRELAECFRRSFREEDVICRYGGEEFVVIMPDVTEEIASRRAETFRSAVAEIRTEFRGEDLRETTISVGIAMYPDADRDGVNLVRLADGALYRAKQAGRNQVVLESTSAMA